MNDSPSPFRWFVLLLLFLNIFFVAMAMVIVSPLKLEILKDIPMNEAQWGPVMGVVTLASLLFAPIGGSLSDKVGCRWVYGGAALIAAVAGYLRHFAESPTGLIACMFFIGGALAVFTTIMPKALSNWFPPQDIPKTNGMGMAGMGLGQAIAMGIATKVLSPSLGGWRPTMVALSVVGLILAVLWVVFYRDRQAAAGGPQQQAAGGFKDVLGVRAIWLIALFYGLVMVDLMGLTAFLPGIFAQKGISEGLVGIWMLTSVVFNIVGVIVSDIVGRRKPFLVFSGILFGLCIPTFLIFTGAPLVISLVLAGVAVGTIVPIVMIVPIEMKEIGPALAGTALGFIFMLGNAGGFIGPMIAGIIIDSAKSPTPALLFMAAVIIIAGFIALTLPETGRKKG